MLGAGLDADLAEVTTRCNALLGEVTAHGLVDLLLLDVAETELNSLVAVGLSGLHLANRVGLCLDNGDGDDLVVLVENLGHADLFTEDSVDHSRYPPYSLISMSTPAGRSRRMSESTVLGVGSRMSMRRL